MPRTKGSKNKPKTETADFATQLAEKQSVKEALSAELASITVNIDTLKADLKVKKATPKKAEKEVAALEAKKAKADAKAAIIGKLFNISVSCTVINIIILIVTCMVYTFSLLHGFNGISSLASVL